MKSTKRPASSGTARGAARGRALKPLPLCESFLGGHFRAWCGTSDPLAAGDSATALYGVVNDLDDETVERLREWRAAGFPHVCG
jgi:hypothetical protein